jgi:hypothetical protein
MLILQMEERDGGEMLFWVNKRIYCLFTKCKHLGNNRFLLITSGLMDHAIRGYSEIILHTWSCVENLVGTKNHIQLMQYLPSRNFCHCGVGF